MSVWVVLFVFQSHTEPHRHNLLLPGRPPLKLLGKLSQKGAPWAKTGAETFHVPEDERNPQHVTHTQTPASKWKLRMTHRHTVLL